MEIYQQTAGTLQVDGVMMKDVIVPLNSLLEISQIVRQILLDAAKGQHTVTHQRGDQKSKDEKAQKTVLGTNFSSPTSFEQECQEHGFCVASFDQSRIVFLKTFCY